MNHREPANLPFDILAFGHFLPKQVHVHLDPSPRPTTPQLEALIAEEWDRQIALAKHHGRELFNGSLMRYVDHAVTLDHAVNQQTTTASPNSPRRQPAGSDLHLTVGPTCYRDFVGTNLFNHHRIEAFGWHRFANPIGTTATLTTRDGRICYGRRSARVAYHALHVHTFGGGLEASDRSPDGTIDPFASLCRELAEELNLARDELGDLLCVGLIRDKEIRQPEMLFEADLDLTADQLIGRWKSAQSRDEHDEIVTLSDTPEAIVPFIRHCGPIAPVAIGALFLHGRRRWGRRWFEDAAAE